MFHGHLDYFPKLLLRGKPNTKSRDFGETVNEALGSHKYYNVLISIKFLISTTYYLKGSFVILNETKIYVLF